MYVRGKLHAKKLEVLCTLKECWPKRGLLQDGQCTSQARAYNDKYLMFQMRIVSDQVENKIYLRSKGLILFHKVQLACANVLSLYQMLSFYEMKSFTRAL